MSSLQGPMVSLVECPETQLHYVRRQHQKDHKVIFWLQIKKDALADWRGKIYSGTLNTSYIDLVNLNLPGNAMRIDRYSQRLEKRLSNFAIEMLNKRCTLNKKGSLSQREDFKNTPKKISVLQSEIITVDEWEKQIDVLKGNLDTARSEMSQWKEKDKKLEEEEALFKELINEKKNAEFEVVSEEKDSMKKYIRQLEREELTSANYTPLPHLKTRQAQNKRLKQLKTRAQKALYFVSLFGLKVIP